jgi:hypothetical protein
LRANALLPRIRSSIATAVIVTGSVVALGAQVPADAAAAQTSPVTPACAWYDFSVSTDNASAPDSAATYWLLPFTVQEGLRIVLDGRYPDSRYASLEAYTSGGALFSTNGVESALTDYRIAPDPGSVNPWQRATRHTGAGGDAFTVTLQSDVTQGQVNTLPLAPAGTAAGTAGYLIYRVYLPARGDFSQVPLPVVTFTLDGVSQQVPACPPGTTSAQPSGTAPAATPAGVPADAPAQSVEFAPVKTTGGGAPNADSGYLAAVVTPPGNGDVLVIQGKAPTASLGSHPSPWPAPGIDLRYWSLCNYLATAKVPLVVNQLPGGGVDYGCRYDSQVRLDQRGYYTFVVGTEAQRAAIDQIPGATFLPFSTAEPTTEHFLLLRNMLANPDFAEAIQNVPQGGSAASAAAVMGAYYPQAAICSLATLASDGPAACLAGQEKNN